MVDAGAGIGNGVQSLVAQIRVPQCLGLANQELLGGLDGGGFQGQNCGGRVAGADLRKGKTREDGEDEEKGTEFHG